MPGAVVALEVDGLGEFQRALARIDKTLARELKNEFRAAADPIRVQAEALALEKIRRMKRSPQWSKMRVGVTSNLVYIAPRLHGVKSHRDPKNRPNLVDLLLGRAMEPALAAGESHLIAAAERALEHVGIEWQQAA